MIKEVDYEQGLITLEITKRKGKKKEDSEEINLDIKEAYEIYDLIKEEKEYRDLEEAGRECLKEKYNQVEDDSDIEEELHYYYEKQKRQFLENNRKIIFKLAYLDVLEAIEGENETDNHYQDEDYEEEDYEEDYEE